MKAGSVRGPVAGTIVLLAAVVAPATPARELTFDERVRHQKAIEEVYWSRRLWPSDNPTPKPPLSAVMTDEAIRARVEDYLKASKALEVTWQRPITTDQLQAELDRIVRETRDGSALSRIFHALGGDPYVIAETFVRPMLADRLIRDGYAYDDRFHGERRGRAKAARETCADVVCMKTMGGAYEEVTRHRDKIAARVGHVSGVDETPDAFVLTAVLAEEGDTFTTATVTWPKIPFDTWWQEQKASLSAHVAPTAGPYEIDDVDLVDCVADTWTPTYLGAPDPRLGHTAVWTGTEMIVWGAAAFSTGGRYNPATNTWTATSSGAGVPSPRGSHTAVWTGTEMIVWGGHSYDTIGEPFNTGARYNPANDTWTPTTLSGAPTARYHHTAVWTGTLMLVWGGVGGSSGARYDPSLDSWSPISGGLPARYNHTAVWSGSEMFIWGGNDFSSLRQSGARYNPVTDLWVLMPLSGAPEPRENHTAVWTGTEMIVWGGEGPGLDNYLNTGASLAFDEKFEVWTWTATQTAGAPTPRSGHSAIWTGSRMVVWGGYDRDFHNSGGIYDPDPDLDPDASRWVPTSTTGGLPLPRYGHTAVWTGGEMIVWGGEGSAGPTNTGSRLDPVLNSIWAATSTGSYSASWRSRHVSVWTGNEMIVWGGNDAGPLTSGGRYNPVTNAWIPTSTTNAPLGRRDDARAVWTGTAMIVWGGTSGTAVLNTGGRYNPSTNTWMPTSAAGGVPAARFHHTAVWTGSEMLVWGGTDFAFSTAFGDGGRYNPSTDTWTAPTAAGAPIGRYAHSAVWTGAEMIVWGGADFYFGPLGFNNGARYSPSGNSWTATSTTGAPAARLNHTAVWSGSEMIVWGGGGVSVGATGGRYNPSTNSWTSMSASVLAERQHASAVWTGTEMVVWGGRIAEVLLPSNAGGRFNPATNSWQPTSVPASVPAARFGHTAVWTGTQMIVWGAGEHTATGGLYCAPLCAPPGETSFGSISKVGSTVRFNFLPAAGTTTFDVLEGDLDFLPVGNATEVCRANDISQAFWDDTNIPSPGQGRWVLVRGVGSCGSGTLGTGRNSTACP